MLNYEKEKNPVIIIGIVLALCLIGVGIFALTANSAGRRLTERLELGRKYLEEMDYEQAIVAFEAAIAIAPKCEEAYLVLAETYVAQGTGDSGMYLPGEDIYVATENVEKAMEVLKEGYRQTSSETISTRLEELRDCYQTWKEGGVSSVGNEPGAGGQDTDGSQASGNSEAGSQEAESTQNTSPISKTQSIAEVTFLGWVKPGELITDADDIPYKETDHGEGWGTCATYYCDINDEPKYVIYEYLVMGDDMNDIDEFYYTTYEVYMQWLEGYKAWILENDYDYNQRYMYELIHPDIEHSDGTYEVVDWEFDYSWRFENE